MKKLRQKLTICLASVLYALGLGTPVWAQDIEIFANPDLASIPVNVMFILDFSDSMNEPVPGGGGQTRLEALKEAMNEILSEKYTGLKIGIQNFAGDTNPLYFDPVTNTSSNLSASRYYSIGIDFPVSDVNQNPWNIDPGIPKNRFNTVADLFKHMINDMQTSNKTPTVTALYEATRYYRGEAVLEGRQPPPTWDVARDRYSNNGTECTKNCGGDPTNDVFEPSDDSRASHEKTYAGGAYEDVTTTTTATVNCRQPIYTSGDSNNCKRADLTLVANSCVTTPGTTITTTKVTSSSSGGVSGLPVCQTGAGKIVLKDVCTATAPKVTTCIQWDLTGTECLKTQTTGGECTATEKQIDANASTPPNTKCYYKNANNKFWIAEKQTTTTAAVTTCTYQYPNTTTSKQWVGAPTYISPIQYMCQQSYIVLLSDGAPSSNRQVNNIDDYLKDRKYISPVTNNVISSTAHCMVNEDEALKDVSQSTSNQLSRGFGKCGADLIRFLNKYDQMPGLEGDQTVQTYTIGFNLADGSSERSYLQNLAKEGLRKVGDKEYGGKYIDANNKDELVSAFKRIIAEIRSDNATFVVPSTAIDPSNLLANREEVYLSLFAPSVDNPRWAGNIKGFYLSDDEYRDLDGVVATDEDGIFVSDRRSFWYPTGSKEPSPLAGGLADQLKKQSRTIYTYTGADGATDVDLTTAQNRLSVSNDVDSGGALTNELLGLDPAAPAVYRQELLTWASGSSIGVGESLHTTPVFVPYADNKFVLYAVTNDGFLHAINATKNGVGSYDSDNSGAAESPFELFAFMPKELLPNLEEMKLNTGRKIYGLDGSLAVWFNDADPTDGAIDASKGDHVYLYFGMRRGGSNYYALDVTDLDNPKLMWTLKGGADPFKRLGQTWSKPVLTQMKVGTTDKRHVLVFAGGYDTQQDNQEGLRTVRGLDHVGNALYIVDAETGDLLWAARGPVAALIAELAGEIATLESSTNPDGVPMLTAACTAATNNFNAAPNDKDLEAIMNDVCGDMRGAQNRLNQLQVAKNNAETDAENNYIGGIVDGMLYSIPSEVRMLDTDANGLADRLYVGDMGGQVWRVDFPGGLADRVEVSAGGTQTTISYPGLSAGDDTGGSIIYRMADLGGSNATSNRRFYYPPSVSKVLDNGEARLSVAIGSGFRARPLNTIIQDRFYVLKDGLEVLEAVPSAERAAYIGKYPYLDPNNPVVYTETDLKDMTNEVVNEDTTDTEVAALNTALEGKSGWYLTLAAGEKVLAKPLTFENRVMFTTYNANVEAGGDICAEGFAPETRFYMVDLLNAAPVERMDQTDANGDGQPDTVGSLTADDRSLKLDSIIIPAEPYVVHTPPKDGADDSLAAGETCVNVGSECMTRVTRSLKLLRWQDKTGS